MQTVFEKEKTFKAFFTHLQAKILMAIDDEEASLTCCKQKHKKVNKLFFVLVKNFSEWHLNMTHPATINFISFYKKIIQNLLFLTKI